MRRQKYKVVTYSGGVVKNELNTSEKKLVVEEYAKSKAGNVAVRVWINGRKLTYSESNKMFDGGYISYGFKNRNRKE